MADKIYHHVGIVHFCKKRNCRKILLKVKSDGEVYVSLPLFCSIRRAEDFVESQIDWILERQATIKQKRQIIDNNRKQFTHFHTLEIVNAIDNSFRYKVTQDNIKILLPNSQSIDDEIAQEHIQAIIVETLRAEAKQYIPQRVHELATQHGLTYTQVKISSAKTRWGCCNSRKNLTFTLFLMTLPYHLIDFVILHELCHTVHMNHGDAFYDLHNQLLGGKLREYEKEIKTCKMDVFPKWE